VPNTNGDSIAYNFATPYTSSSRIQGADPTTGTKYIYTTTLTGSGDVVDLVAGTCTTTSSGTRYVLPIIQLENININSSDNVTAYAVEYVKSANPNTDVFSNQAFTRFVIGSSFNGIKDLVDSTIGHDIYLTEGQTTPPNYLTYDTSGGAILSLAKSSSTIFNDANAICKIVYNNSSAITSSTVADNQLASSSSAITFTPPTTAVNSPGINGISINIRFFQYNKIPSRQASINVLMILPTVKFSPVSGSDLGLAGDVTLTNSLSTAAIYYTLTGVTPTINSNQYAGPIHIRTAATIKAFAYKAGWVQSNVSSASFLINNQSVADSYGMVNIKCGTQLDETVFANASDYVVLSQNLDGSFKQAGVGGLGSPTGAISPYAKRWKGLGVFGLTANDYWNILKPAQNNSWIAPVDTQGQGNANATLQVREFFGTTDAVPYFGQGITSITAPGATQVDALENSGITSSYGDNTILVHVKGLNPGKYMVLAYGQKTEFDLDIYDGNCPVKTSNTKAFYNFGYPLFNSVTSSLQKYYTHTVYPVRVFAIKGIQSTSGGFTAFNWAVTQLTTAYVPYALWSSLVNGSLGALTNQQFFDADSYTPGNAQILTTQGIVYMPSTANYTINNASGLIGSTTSALAENSYIAGYVPGGSSTVSVPVMNLYPGLLNQTITSNVQSAAANSAYLSPTISATLSLYTGIPPSTISTLNYEVTKCYDLIAIAPGHYDQTYSQFPASNAALEIPVNANKFVTNDVQSGAAVPTSRVSVATVSVSSSGYLKVVSNQYQQFNTSGVLGFLTFLVGSSTTINGQTYYHCSIYATSPSPRTYNLLTTFNYGSVSGGYTSMTALINALTTAVGGYNFFIAGAVTTSYYSYNTSGSLPAVNNSSSNVQLGLTSGGSPLITALTNAFTAGGTTGTVGTVYWSFGHT